MILRLGSRASRLALYQSQWVAARLQQSFPDLKIEIIEIKTQGDKILDVPLAKIGGKGLFVKELDEALLDGRIDLAVHSMKDVPTDLPKELQIAALTFREDPRDVLISRNNIPLEKLPKGAVIGTSSLRRQAQMLHYSKDFKIVSLRGNLDTRIKRIKEKKLDAIILAAAGIHRLGWHEKISEYLPIHICLPAIAQGVLGIEVHSGRDEVKQIVSVLDHPKTRKEVLAERALLKELEGGCQVPIAAFGELNNSTLRLQALVASVDGERIIKDCLEGPLDDPESIGIRLARKLIDQGADKILDEVKLNK